MVCKQGSVSLRTRKGKAGGGCTRLAEGLHADCQRQKATRTPIRKRKRRGPSENWPIIIGKHVVRFFGTSMVELLQGAACVYAGAEVEHRREHFRVGKC